MKCLPILIVILGYYPLAASPALPVTLSDPVAYPGTVVAIVPAGPVVRVPDNLLPGPKDANLKLWVSDPRRPALGLAGGGIWLQPTGGQWARTDAREDGAVFLRLAPGAYDLDSCEPAGPAGAGMLRHRYHLTVGKDRKVSIQGLNPNANGFFGLVLDLAQGRDPVAELTKLQAASDEAQKLWTPTSPAMLRDQTTAPGAPRNGLSAGFPKSPFRLPSFGHVKALIVAVDFPDVPGEESPSLLFTPVAVGVRDFFYRESGERLAFDFSIVPQWTRLPFTSKGFVPSAQGGGEAAGNYFDRLINLTSGSIDFSTWDVVYFLVPPKMPASTMPIGPAYLGPHLTPSGVLLNAVTGGADMYDYYRGGDPGSGWRWMSHETGHLLGFFDEDWHHQRPTLGSWSIMAQNWSTEAFEFGAWDRFLQGWLDPVDLTILDLATAARGTTVKLAPVVRPGQGPRGLLVVLSKTLVLVAESRRAEGFDRLAPGQEGLLVYTVDMTRDTLEGGYVTLPRNGAKNPEFTDAALKPGDKISVAGLTVEVTVADADGDTVLIRGK